MTKAKGTKVIQTKPTQFWNGVQENNWWYWFKQHHPITFILQAKGLEICRTQGLIQ
jgi:hypothetical protein